MNFTSFISHLKAHGPVPEQLITEVRKRCEPFNAPDRTTLIEPGKTSKFIYFISEGLTRAYRVFEMKQHIIGFSGPDEFIADGQGFLKNTFSEIGVQCHSDTCGIRIRTHDWTLLCEDNPIFMQLSRNILLGQLLKMERQSVIYRTGETKAKLIQLMTLHPGITNKVARRHIGNFFGTTEQSITNIISQMRSDGQKPILNEIWLPN